MGSAMNFNSAELNYFGENISCNFAKRLKDFMVN